MQAPNFVLRVNGNEWQQSICALDQGLLYGFGFFETMRAFKGRILFLDYHLERLYQAAERFGWPLPWAKEFLQEALVDALIPLDDLHLSVRLTVTRGAHVPADFCEPAYIIFVRSYTPPTAGHYEKGWSLVPLTSRKHSSSIVNRVKSLNYLDNMLGRQEAKALQADEGLFFNERGEVAEGAMSTLFLVTSEGILETPYLNSGILNGVTRRVVLELNPCHEKPVTLDEVYSATELFCTNSLIGVMPVTRWAGLPVGKGGVGPFTRAIQSSYLLKTSLSL